MTALPRPIVLTAQVIAALVLGIVLSVFVGPFLDNSDTAVGAGGSGGIHPGPQDGPCTSLLCGDTMEGSAGTLGNVPEGNWLDGGTGGSGGVLGDAPTGNALTCEVCLGGEDGSGGTVGEVPTAPTGSGGSGGTLPGPASPAPVLLGGSTATGSVGNVG